MSTYVIPPARRLDALGDMVASGAVFDGLHVHLLKSAVTITKTTTLADLEAAECDFGGYAPAAVTWGTPFLDAVDNAVALGGLLQFTQTDLSSPNSVYGYWLQKSASTQADLILMQLFDDEVALTEIGNAVVVCPKVVYAG